MPSSAAAASKVPTRTSRRGPKRRALWSVSMRPTNIDALKHTRLAAAVLALAPKLLCSTNGAQPSTAPAAIPPTAPSRPRPTTSFDSG